MLVSKSRTGGYVVETGKQLQPVVSHRPAKLKNLRLIVTAGLIFGLGLAIGRGDVDIDGLSASRAGSSTNLDYSSVEQLYGVLNRTFDGELQRDKLLEGLKEGLVSAADDPYTEYLSPKEAKELNEQLSGSFTGIGAELGKDKEGNLIVVSPLSGFPADKAGLRPRDVIAAINGESAAGISINTAVTKIRGEVGSKVKLTLIRDGGNPFEVEITREKITIPSVEHKMDGNIGYLKINQFTEDTARLSKAAANDFKRAGAKGVVLDLRGNPGGYLSASIDVAGLWLDRGKVVVSERRGKTIINSHYASGDNPLKNIPTAVLINGGSASASEIVAGALKDYKAATIVGKTSFGKGSVQKVENLRGGSELKVTIARWYTPLGKNIDKQGVSPDQEIELSDDDAQSQRDPQKDKALELLRSQVR